MNPYDIPLDAHGFPIARTFDDVPRPAANVAANLAADTAATDSEATLQPLPKPHRAGHLVRHALVIVAIFAAVMAISRSRLGQPIGRAVAGWLARHAVQKFEAEDIDGALVDLDRAIAWSGSSPEIFFLRGQLRMEKGDLQGGLADFNKLVELAPDVSDAYVLRARAFQRMKNHDAAIRDVTHAISLHRNLDPDLLNTRAYTRAIAETELDEALEDIDRALKIEGENASFRDTRGYILLLQGKSQEALDDLNLAIETENARTPQNLFFRGDRRAERRVARLNREHTQALAVMYHHRGQAREQLNESALAEEDFRRAVEMGYDPEKGVY